MGNRKERETNPHDKSSKSQRRKEKINIAFHILLKSKLRKAMVMATSKGHTQC